MAKVEQSILCISASSDIFSKDHKTPAITAELIQRVKQLELHESMLPTNMDDRAVEDTLTYLVAQPENTYTVCFS